MGKIKRELIEKYNEIVELLDSGKIDLNNWEEEFIDNIESQLEADGFLTDLQIEKLEQIYEKYNR